jgi:hypothetical protein
MDGSPGDRRRFEGSGRPPATEARSPDDPTRSRPLHAAAKWVAGIAATVVAGLILWALTQDTTIPAKPRPQFKGFAELVDYDTQRRATLETRITNTGDRRAEILRFEFFYKPTGELGGLRPSPRGLDRLEQSRSDRLPTVVAPGTSATVTFRGRTLLKYDTAARDQDARLYAIGFIDGEGKAYLIDVRNLIRQLRATPHG